MCVAPVRVLYAYAGRQLVLAIQRSGINILNTFVLAVLAIYVFAVVTFLVFKDPTRVDKGDGEN